MSAATPAIEASQHAAYSLTELRRLLARHGFRIEEAWSDLTGRAWHRSSPTVAVLAHRRR